MVISGILGLGLQEWLAGIWESLLKCCDAGWQMDDMIYL
jgi:hypothetical protein